MNCKLAITGITGKTGEAFAEYLSMHMDNVLDKFQSGIKILARSSSRLENTKKLLPIAEITYGDLQDELYLENQLDGVDTIVHIAGIKYSENIVKVTAKCHVRRLILVHTTGIYSKYKEAGEEYRRIDSVVYDICNKEGIILTILRPTMIYGCLGDHNVHVFTKMVDKLPMMPVVNGAKYQLQPVYYKDLGRAYYQVLMNEEKTANQDFDLSGKEPITLREMLLEIGNCLGKKVHFISVPFELAFLGAVVIYIISFRNIDYREKVQRLCEPRVYSHAKATEAFGYDPVEFKVGVSKELEEYKS